MPNSLELLGELLKQEKWTRTTISEFSINTFQKYDEIIDHIIQQDKNSAALDICENNLKQTPNSVISLYFISMIYTKSGFYDSSYAQRLVNIFKENHKQNIVKKLCEKYLETTNSKFILSEYISILEKEKSDDVLILPYWEKLAKLDYTEVKTSKKLAKYFEESGDKDRAIYYYKKIFEHSLRNKLVAEIESVWNKLIELNDENYEYFFNGLEKIAEFNVHLAMKLGEDFITFSETTGNWGNIVQTIKIIYRFIPVKFKDSKAGILREKIQEAYKNLYGNHSNFEDCLKRSQLNQSWKNLYDAISIFEKYIPFDKGNWVYHNKAGLGYIKDIKDDFLIIDFPMKNDHGMKVDMALKSLFILEPDNLLVIKEVEPKKLEDLLKNYPGEIIKRTIKALNNRASSTEMKKYLVANNIIAEKEWTSLWNRAKEELKNDPLFFKSLEKANEYILREKPVSYEDSSLEEFKAYNEVIDKAKVVKQYLEEGGDPNHDNFAYMLQFFQNLINPELEVSPNFVLSYIFLMDLKKIYQDLPISFPFDMSELFNQLGETNKFYFEIPDSFFEKQFFDSLIKYFPDWQSIMVQYLKSFTSKYALSILIVRGETVSINDIIRDITKNYRDKADLFIWYCKNLFFKESDLNLAFKKEDIIMQLVNLLDYVNKALIQKIETGFNRKIYNQITEILFKDKELENLYKTAPKSEIAVKIPRLFFRIKEMKPEFIVEYKIILSKYNTDVLADLGLEEKEEANKNIFYVTRDAIIEKQKYLQNLLQKEIPRTSSDMAAAKEKGDLRENAEYIAARERLQELNEEAANLQKELNNSFEIDFANIDTSKVSIGTTVEIFVEEDKKTISYSILGKWDVNLSKNIISYETTIGQLLLNKKPGDKVYNSQDKKTYKINKILKYQ